jgi:hypothetical protein
VIDACRDCGIPVIGGAKRCNRCTIEYVHRTVWRSRRTAAIRTAFAVVVILEAMIAIVAYLMLVMTGSC